MHDSSTSSKKTHDSIKGINNDLSLLVRIYSFSKTEKRLIEFRSYIFPIYNFDTISIAFHSTELDLFFFFNSFLPPGFIWLMLMYLFSEYCIPVLKLELYFFFFSSLFHRCEKLGIGKNFIETDQTLQGPVLSSSNLAGDATAVFL